MLDRTFQCIKGIGDQMEQKMWQSGIRSWDDVNSKVKPDFLSDKVWQRLQVVVPRLQTAWKTQKYPEVAELIPSKVQWRMIPEFLGKIAYLDIETTGLDKWNNYVTTIAVFDGQKVHTFIHGQNLDTFPEFIAKFPAIVTFFGKGFDIPFLQAYFKRIDFQVPPIHFDTCFLLRRLGLKGGLKKIEHYFGWDRGELEGINGDIGVMLWFKYLETHDEGYLNALLAYNTEDVLNLDYLVRYAYNGLLKLEGSLETPVEIKPRTVKNPYYADPKLVKPLIRLMDVEEF